MIFRVIFRVNMPPGAGSVWSHLSHTDRLPPSPQHSTALDPTHFTLSVLVPVYNEERTLATIAQRIRSAPIRTEVICVNDGSRDGSRAVLDQLLAEGIVDVVVHKDRNEGKGAAIRAAIARSTGDVVIVQDADLEYDPADWPQLLQPIIDGKADAVYGSRFLGGPHRVLFYWHYVGNRALTTMSNMFTNVNLTDMETGYKAIRGELARSLKLTSNRFGFEPEVTARLVQAKARLYEVPISYFGRTYEEGKKIGWKDGAAAVWHIIRCNVIR